jgi:hypothetical protein
MIKIRMHRGGLQESMETMMKCDSIESIVHYLLINGVNINTVKVERYDINGDDRIGWNKVYIIQGKFKNCNLPKNVIYPLAFSDTFFELPKIGKHTKH